MLWSSEIPEAKINLTTNRDQDMNNISSCRKEGNLAWTKVQAPTQAEPLSAQSRLQVGVREKEEQLVSTFHTYKNLQTPHLWAVSVMGYKVRKEDGR